MNRSFGRKRIFILFHLWIFFFDLFSLFFSSFIPLLIICFIFFYFILVYPPFFLLFSRNKIEIGIKLTNEELISVSLSFPSDTEMMAGSGTKSGISSGSGMRTRFTEKGSDSVDWISFLDFFNILLTVRFFIFSFFFTFFFYFLSWYYYTHFTCFFFFTVHSRCIRKKKFFFFIILFLFCLFCFVLILIFSEKKRWCRQ